LPLGTRQTLPPLRLNMHVYNPDPARRFAIIDGTRAIEGAPLGKELNVESIQPDGVVLVLRGERFLLPRTGH
jgi:general secretion pathway protein B